MRRWAFRPALVVAAGLTFGLFATCASAGLEPVAEGQVRFHQPSRASFDDYTDDPTPAQQQWMREHYLRMKVFTSYFDSRLSWFPNAWVYRNAYAIYPGSNTFAENPDWVLRDANGNMLFIPYDCEGGTCPQFAGDFGNPAFRANWIARLEELIDTGYIGVWIDDVNLSWRISNGNGDFVTPIDPRTGNAMTLDDWQRYLAEFMEAIRAAQPDIEIVHNALWNTATPENDNISVDRQVDAADYISLERGASDRGLVGGSDSHFGFESFLGFVDYVHARGRAVILMDEAQTMVERELALAGWFLISDGNDLMSSENLDWVTPDTWWHGYELNIGAASGPRYEWNGLIRRDFDCGFVVVNQPDRPTVSATLAETVTTLENEPVTMIELGPASAAVLLQPCVAVANVIDTAPFGSSDPSGVSFLPATGALLVSDSEVNETPFFTGNNVFQLTTAGTAVNQFSTLGFSSEPGGVAYNTRTGTVFVADDDLKTIFEMDITTPTPSVVSSVALASLGILDSDGISFDPATGHLYVLDGGDGPGTRTIYEITISGGLVSSVFVGSLVPNPDGVYYDLTRDSFFVVSASSPVIVEISRSGQLIAEYDLQSVADTFGNVRPKGVTLAPSSDPDDDPGARNLYFADQGIDGLNDGRVFEITLNLPPVGDVDADGIPDRIDNCVDASNTEQSDTDGDGYGNLCDADLNNDCSVNPLDLGLLRDAFFGAGPDADFNGDGVVNPVDLGIMRRLFFLPPGPSGLPGACSSPSLREG